MNIKNPEQTETPLEILQNAKYNKAGSEKLGMKWFNLPSIFDCL